jgi:hypothetical protein
VGAPAQVLDLIERFERNADAYRSTAYNEAQTRREFIDPFFKALGWDIDNEAGYAEAYKDVIHEDAIKVGGLTKAPDYCFRVGGARKFFVEAKKPSVNIKTGIDPAFQLRRYAWSAKLPLSILTDFEELAVYDCRVRPDKTDGAATARTIYLPYTRYDQEWETLAGTFSKQAVLQGSFDKYAETTKGKKGTAEVDAAFLKEIEEWRDSLARTIALRNASLSQRELNYAVQATIDRLIFLRICEDRGIDDYGRLQGLLNGGDVYKRLLELYRHADERYNSGLFHFERERGRAEAPDELTPALSIDDKALKDILKRLYYPDSPYEFSVLPADILGQVYEQFLGKVIRLTAGHRAVVEDKPEVKKAGGVYYTPTYIVDYIVKNTVGKLLENSTPKKAAALRVLDPACGSGSFLIGAYQCLLDWHRDWYVADGADKHKKELYQGPGGEWRLITAEKKRILLNNIHGVDIDSQAVETTKLSLLLKVLEGETQETINAQLSFVHERALPDLAANIKCGNSLIGPEFYEEQDRLFLDEEEAQRINVFGWSQAFPSVVSSGGFHSVIGNPPYGGLLSGSEVGYAKKEYPSYVGVSDVYVAFMERGLRLLRSNGLLGFIVPSAWLGGPSYRGLRHRMLESTLEHLVLMPFDVFDAFIDTVVFTAQPRAAEDGHTCLTFEYPKRERIQLMDAPDLHGRRVLQSKWHDMPDEKIMLDPEALDVMDSVLDSSTHSLGQYILMRRGVLLDRGSLHADREEGDLPYFEGDVYRHRLNEVCTQWVALGSHFKEGPKDRAWYVGRRLLVRRLVNRRQRLMAAIASGDYVTNKNLYIVKSESVPLSRLAALANSRLWSYLYVRQVTQAVKDDFPQVTVKDLAALPCPPLDDDSLWASVDRAMGALEHVLSLAEAKSAAIQPMVKAADRALDTAIMNAYGLSASLQAIVFEAVQDDSPLG